MKRLFFVSIVQVLFLSLLTVQISFAQSLEVSNGVASLVTSQNTDGSWGGNTSNTDQVTATATVLETLASLGETGSPAYLAGEAWLAAQDLTTTDHISRRILAGSSVTSDVEMLVSLVDDMRKAWGGAEEYDVNILDTALALQALKRINSSDVTTIGYALNFLLASQNSDGGWGFTETGESNPYMTAVVSLALQQFEEIYNFLTPINNAKSYLLSHQTADGGFGYPQSTIHETALSMLVLLDSHLNSPEMATALQNIITTQDSDGSWLQEPFHTALALMALDREEKTPQPVPPSAISGTIVDGATWQPVAEAIITITGSTVFSTMSEQNGNYILEPLDPDWFEIVISKEGYLTVSKIVEVKSNQTIFFSPALTTNSTPPPASDDTAGITGSVTDFYTGQVLTEIEVTTATADITETTFTDTNGRFTFSGLPSGMAHITLNATGFYPMSLTINLQDWLTIDLGQLEMRTEIDDTGTPLFPDLIIEFVNLANLSTDLQTLELSGTLDIELGNQGDFSSPPPSLIAFYDADNNGSYESTTDLYLGEASGSTFLDPSENQLISMQIRGTLPYRDAPISVWADNSAMIEESDEGNNSFTSSILCNIETTLAGSNDPVLEWQWSGTTTDPSENIVIDSTVDGQPSADTLDPHGMPDLSAAMLRITDNGSGAFDLTARIGNGGTLAVSQNIDVSFYKGDPGAGGRLLGNIDLTNLPANSFVDAKLENITDLVGIAEIYVSVDPDNLIVECNESNNGIQTAAPHIWADLEVSALQIVDNGANTPLSTSFMVGNIGAQTSNDHTMVAYYNGDPLVDGVLLGTMEISSIPPGGTTSVSYANLSGMDSSDTLFVVADANDRLQEYNECNNSANIVLPAAEQGLLSLTTDKQAYGSGEDVVIAVQVTNTSALTGDFVARLRIEDQAGFLVEELATVQIGVVSSGTTVPVNTQWNTADYLTREYLVRGLLDSTTSSDLHEMTVSFVIGSPDPQSSPLSLRTTTDKVSYQPGETVLIHDLLTNQSGNTIIDNTVLQVTVTDQAGTSLFNNELSAGQLLPNMLKDFQTLFVLAATPAGHYTVSGKVTDISDGTILVDDTATFEVLGTGATGAGLTGHIIAASEVFMGRELILGYDVINDGNQDINALTVRVVVINPATDELSQTLGDVAQLDQGTTHSANLSSDTSLLTPGLYMAVLSVLSPEMTAARTLASVNFEVLPSLEVSTETPELINLLVWLNDKCSPHEDDLACDDYEESCNVSCIRQDLLETVLQDAAANYLLVSDRADFERELRNPFFTDIMILGDHHPLTGHLDEELRERVYSGTGLISSLWAEHASAESIFGIKVTGKLANDCSDSRTVQTLAGAFTFDDSIDVRGRVHRVTALEPDKVLAGWISDDQGNSRRNDQHPVIVLSEYGSGKAVFYGFDLGLTLNDSNYEQLARLISDTISHVHNPVNTESYLPYQLAPVTTRLKSLGGSFNVRLTDIYAEELSLYDQLIGTWVAGNPKVTETLLEVDEQLDLTYFALTPDEAGTYSITTEVDFVINEDYTPFDTVLHEVGVGLSTQELLDDIDDALTVLRGSVNKSSKIKNAIDHFNKARDRLIYERADIEKNIHDIEKAIAALLSDGTVDVSVARLLLTKLLIIEQGRWYFHVQ